MEHDAIADGGFTGASAWLRSLDRIAADAVVLHHCLDLEVDDVAEWIGVSVDEVRAALDRSAVSLEVVDGCRPPR